MATDRPIQEKHRSITPFLVVKNAAEAIEFYKKALEAKEITRVESLEGKISHAELQIGDSMIVLADENPESVDGSYIGLQLHVEDAIKSFQNAADTGMEIIEPLNEKNNGDRDGTFKDPYGLIWSISSHSM